MCYIHWRPEEWDYDRSPDPRPRPQLKWVIPINIAELGASLAAHLNQSPQITALRLCHRVGDGALSRLPQEILDQIISDAHRMEKAAIQPKWERKSLCFQGRCTRSQHFRDRPSDTKELLSMLFGRSNCHYNEPLNSDDYPEERKVEMIEDYLEEEGYESWDDWIWEAHDEGQSEWVNLICLCNKTAAPKKTAATFAQLHSVLETEFGLEAIVLHEVLSDNMREFLPDVFGMSACSYYTSCFLTLPPTEPNKQSGQDRTSAHKNRLFLKEGNHLAFHDTVDPSHLKMDEKQRIRFARAMRILDLQPYYHMSELEAIIKPTTQDNSLWEICHYQIPGCPKPTDTSRTSKVRKLKQFITSKSYEMAKGSWPQLKIITASDAVGPMP